MRLACLEGHACVGGFACFREGVVAGVEEFALLLWRWGRLARGEMKKVD
jgi:hypothetical protein